MQGACLIPDQGTRYQVQQLKVWHVAMKTPGATTKTWHRQIKIFKNKISFEDPEANLLITYTPWNKNELWAIVKDFFQNNLKSSQSC